MQTTHEKTINGTVIYGVAGLWWMNANIITKVG
jgi:hypothetical protein